MSAGCRANRRRAPADSHFESGSLIRLHIHGTYVPVEKPSTPSKSRLLQHQQKGLLSITSSARHAHLIS
jgi:hypothetical protein